METIREAIAVAEPPQEEATPRAGRPSPEPAKVPAPPQDEPGLGLEIRMRASSLAGIALMGGHPEFESSR